MAGKTGQALLGGQQQQAQAPPTEDALASQPLTQADLYNLQSQQRGQGGAAPVFAGGGEDAGARVAAIRQLLAGGAGAQGRQMKPLKQAGER